jgi:neutral ceramidase
MCPCWRPATRRENWHATTLSYQKWNGDWPGYAMAELEATNKGCTALFFAGCGADQNPIPRRTQELAQKYGKQLAEAVNALLKEKPKTKLTAESQATYQEIELPLQDPPTREKLIEESMSKDKFLAARAKMWLDRLAKNETLPTKYPYPVQTWRIGSQMLVTLGGEVVVDYSLRLKKEHGAGTWVMAYANDVMAYIPSERVLKEGGYEGASSMIYYGLPSLWSNKCEAAIVAEVMRQHKATK